MKRIWALLHDENGEVMLESTIIMLLTIFILIAMISVGFLFYQQSMVTCVANDLAADLASSYKIGAYDTSNVSSNALNNVKLYRTSVAMAKMKEMHTQTADKLVKEKVSMATLGITTKEPTVSNIDLKLDNIGRMHFEVTVSMECEILFGGALKYFGIIQSNPTFTATGRAECLDITSYASHVQFVQYIGTKLAKQENLNKTVTTILGIFQDANSIKDMLFGG